MKIQNTYSIPLEILNRQMLDGERNMTEMLNNSVIFQIEKKRKKVEQDRLAQQRRRKKKIKKKEKMRLPSE